MQTRQETAKKSSIRACQRANVLRQNFVNNALQEEEEGEENAKTRRKVTRLDEFLSYTTLSGVRFLHSRHPAWFR